MKHADVLRRVPFAAWFALALLTPGLVGGLAVLAAVWLTALPADAALRVDGTVVTKRQLEDRVQALQALYGIRPPAASAPGDEFHRQVAKVIATSMVIEKAGREAGIVISDEAARKALHEKIENSYGANGQEQFVELLGRVGASEQDVVDEIKLQNITAVLMQRVGAGVGKATEADARSEFDRHQAEFVAPEKRHLRNIVVETRDQANQIIERARAGKDFVALAQENSLDPSTREAGGDLGQVTKQQLEPDYAQAAFSAPAGQIFGPVRTKSGWNVGQVVDVSPARPLEFDQIKDQLRSQLDAERLRVAWKDWLTARIANTDLEYAPEYRPHDADQPPTGSNSMLVQPGQSEGAER